ncbi:DUF4307 domain-containing protein [Ornithinimicrobium sp. LYQ103]|uniref:DUF4307 domain-containing protein n=1 Tax=Ornithinimicrobium sp. LYQ103 TaxID=3378796 RepID=UPI0038533ABB
MTATPPASQPDPPAPPDGVRDGASAAADWDAEEESAEARRGPRRLGPTQRRTWWVVGTLAVVAMVATSVWFGLAATQGRVHWVDTGHEIVSDSTVDVRFDLRRDPSRAAVCQLEAQDFGHAVVGRTEVTVPPAAESPSRHVEQVRTASPAITGYVVRCWYADEAPPEDR